MRKSAEGSHPTPLIPSSVSRIYRVRRWVSFNDLNKNSLPISPIQRRWLAALSDLSRRGSLIVSRFGPSQSYQVVHLCMYSFPHHLYTSNHWGCSPKLSCKIFIHRLQLWVQFLLRTSRQWNKIILVDYKSLYFGACQIELVLIHLFSLFVGRRCLSISRQQLFVNEYTVC